MRLLTRGEQDLLGARSGRSLTLPGTTCELLGAPGLRRQRLPWRGRLGRDVLLATKLHVPRSRPGFVLRPRLAERLDEGLGQGLVLVCAPAGYGKTVLLADWAQRGKGRWRGCRWMRATTT